MAKDDLALLELGLLGGFLGFGVDQLLVELGELLDQ